MELTVQEIDDLIAAEIAKLTAAGDAAAKKAAQDEIRRLAALRDKAILAGGAILVGALTGLIDDVEEAASTIGDPKTVLGAEGFARKAGLTVAPPAPALDKPAKPPAGDPGDFIIARAAAKLVRVFVDAAGREIARIGGSRAWRNKNPGNIRKGDFAENAGAVGDDGQFAIFPTEEEGYEAIVALLNGATYSKLTLEGAINRYAPPVENDSSAYLNFVADRTGIERGAKLGDLKIAAIRSIADAIKVKEGWIIGEERPHGPASETEDIGASGGVSSATGAVDEWMSIARAEAALAPSQRSEWEAAGKHNPRILEYFRVGCNFTASDDETHWCAAFVNYCLETSGHVGTGHPGARSFFWNKRRQFVKLDAPAPGAVGVLRYKPFSDKKWKTGSGHVGFVTAIHSDSVTLLGGNQSNTVKEQKYRLETRKNGEVTSKFVAFMMPVMN